MLVFTHQGAPLNVAAAAVDDVTPTNQIPAKSLRVVNPDSCDAVLDDPVVPEVLRHDRWNAYDDVVSGMQLAAKWTGLNVATGPLTCITERGVLPVLRSGTNQLFNGQTRVPQG